MKRSILSLAFLSLFVGMYSQTTSWTGAVDSTWHNAANWTAGVPTGTVDAVIGDANYSGTYQPAVLVGASCRALTLNNGFKINVYTKDTIKLGGNLSNNGAIQGDSANFAFNGGSVTVSGTGTAVYKSLYILSGVNCTISKDISLSGDLVVNGSLTATTPTISLVGSSPSVISGTGTITIGNLVQNKTNSYTRLETPVKVMSSLNLSSGIVYTSTSGLLTLADNATSTSGSNSSYVDGPVEKIGDDVFAFPLGNNGVWARLLISAPSLTTDGFVAQYHANPYSNTDSIALSSPVMVNVSKIEYWTCERSAGNSNVSVTLYWEDNTRSDLYDFNSIVVAHWNGSYWENEGSAGLIPLAQGNVTSIVQSSFSPFTFGSTSYSNPMPIGLLDFSAKLAGNGEVNLVWQTATETNNKYFTVERSADGVAYTPIVTVDGAGTSLVNHIYNYTDEQPFEGNTYYRIKQTDLNGNSSYSRVRMVQVSGNLSDLLVYPNPSNGQTFSVGFPSGAKISGITLLDAMGQVVLEEAVDDLQTDSVDLTASSKLAVGVYTVVAVGDEQSYKKKMIVY